MFGWIQQVEIFNIWFNHHRLLLANQNSSSDCVFPAMSDLSRHLFMTYCACLFVRIERCARLYAQAMGFTKQTDHCPLMEHETMLIDDELITHHLTSSRRYTWKRSIAWSRFEMKQEFINYSNPPAIFPWIPFRRYRCYNSDPISWTYIFSLTYFPNHFLTLNMFWFLWR